MACGSVVLVDENNWAIFARTLNGATVKKIGLKSFEEQGRIDLSANFQLSQLPPSSYSSISSKYDVFDKYLDLLAVFTCPKQLQMVSIKIEQNLGLYFWLF